MKKRRSKITARSTHRNIEAEQERFDAADHITEFEAQLADFLVRRCGASGITLSDVKDIVWNEQDSNLLSRFAYELASQNPRTKFGDILHILNNAWNHFTHKRLNGLAPRDMVERIQVNENFTPEARLDFYTLFADRFPKAPRVLRQRDNEWSFEYPASFHIQHTELGAMREKDEEFGNKKEEGSEIEKAERELLHKISVMAAQACLDENPLQFEAAVLLARDAFESGKARLGKSILESAIDEGRKMFPPEFSLGRDHLPWSFVDNRPFLLVLGEYATLVEVTDGVQKAIPLYEELIALNPNDNQGMRAFLATAYLKTNHLDDILKLDKKYPDDAVVELSVGALLVLYKLGRLDEACVRITETQKHLQHVFHEILKTDHPQPELIPGRVRVGGDDEAWLYWEQQGTFWMAAPGARVFLKEQMGGH